MLSRLQDSRLGTDLQLHPAFQQYASLLVGMAVERDAGAGLEIDDGEHEVLAVRRPDPDPGEDLPGLDLIQFQKWHADTPSRLVYQPRHRGDTWPPSGGRSVRCDSGQPKGAPAVRLQRWALSPREAGHPL